MMRSFCKALLLLLVLSNLSLSLSSQNAQKEIDSLHKLLKTSKADTTKVILLNEIMSRTEDAEVYAKYNEKVLKLCEQNIHKADQDEKDFYLLYLAGATINKGYEHETHNNYDKAIKHYLKAQSLLERIKKESENSRTALAYLYNNLGTAYENFGESAKSMQYVGKSIEFFKTVDDPDGLAMAYNNLATHYSDMGEMELALNNYIKCIGIYEKSKNNNGIATVYNNIADMYDKKGNEKEAIAYYLKAYELIKKTDNKNSMAYVMQNIGICYGETGMVKQGVEYLFKALKLFEELKDKRGMYYALSNIGGIFHRDKDIKNAEEYFKKSLKLAQEINYIPGIGASYYRLGAILKETDDLLKAKQYYFKAVSIFETTTEYRMWANSVISLAGVYKKQNVLDSAFFMYQKGLEIADKAQFKLGKSNAIIALADLNFKKGNVEEAKVLAEQGFAMVKEMGYIVEMKNVSDLLYKIYKQLGQKGEALEMHELYVKMNDSIKTEEAQKALISSQLKKDYEELKLKDSLDFAEKNRVVLIKNESQLKKEKLIRYLLGMTALILIVVAGIFYRNNRRKQKQNVLMEQQNSVLEAKNKEKELLMHEVHHRVKNNLQIVSSLLKMPQTHIQDTGALEVMDDSRQRIHSISLIHKLLYEKNDLTHIGAKEYVDELCNAVLNSFTLPDQKVNLKLSINDIKMEVDQFLPLALILNELLLNSIKYAFNKIDDPEISIHLEKKEDQIVFNFSDNGKEDASELIKAKNSFGTKMIFSLTEQLNGLINVYFKNGTNISINFKAA